MNPRATSLYLDSDRVTAGVGLPLLALRGGLPKGWTMNDGFRISAWHTAWVTGWITLRCGRARLSQRAARGFRARVRLAEDSEPYLRLLRDQPEYCGPSHSPDSEPSEGLLGLGGRHGCVDLAGPSQSGRGLPQSKTLARLNGLVTLFVALLLSASVLCSEALSSAALRREPNTTLRLPLSLDDPTALPPTLADTGAFSDLVNLTPQAGIVPYDLNVPFWSDGADKTRWFSVPDINLTVGFEREAPWSFPTGTMWIKHFELQLTNGVPTSRRRIETRFLVRSAEGVYGITYRWDDSQTNATLVASEGLDEDVDIQDQGETHTQVWHYPSRAECLRCHVPIAGFALGFNSPQLNHDFAFAGVTNNQIAALNHAGYFNTNVTGIHTLRALVSATNTAWSLEYRVRSYLAANCAQCHQPGTDCLARWDARISTPTSAAGIIDSRLVFPVAVDPISRVIAPGSLEHSMIFHNIANLKMPPLATHVVNADAVALLSEWITNGLADYQSFAGWQVARFGSTDLPAAAPDADPDGDGASNQLEYLVGSNPLRGGDAWKVSVQSMASSVRILFPRLANRGFEVQWSTNLSDAKSWVALDHPDNRPFFSSTNGQTIIEDAATSSSARFYRVRIFAP